MECRYEVDDSLTGVFAMMWNANVDLLLLDRTILSLDDDHLRLRSKICATLGLI